jgi:acyl carrier protein
MYGPTETTVWSTIQRVSPGSGPVPIGRPVDNTRVYVLNAQRSPAPVGIMGELYIGGAGVARGYLHRDELTTDRFVADPFLAGERMYRTGDLARWLPDGTLECLGRIDNQIKLRGFRIELGEIETQLRTHPAIRQAIVVAREDTPGDKRLVAYYTAADGMPPVPHEELRTYLSTSLPEYMVPARFLELDSFLYTPSGKVDRKAVPAPDAKPPAPSNLNHVAPQTETERKIAAIWCQALNLSHVGREQNFFDLGGHSLLVLRVQTELHREFGRKISVVDMFRYVTVRALAELVSGIDDPVPAVADGRLRRTDAFRRRRELRQRVATEN